MNEKIEAMGAKCLRLTSSTRNTASFLGGKPLVRAPFEWPLDDGYPLGFIGQIDLGEIDSEIRFDWLPQTGRLLFFYDFENCPWGFDPNDRGGWAVVYENGSGDLYHQELPSDLDPDHMAPSTKSVMAESFVSYPDPRRLDCAAVGISDEEDEDDYYDFIDANFGNGPRHQMGGYPYPIQNDNMEEECQLVSGGVYCGDSEGFKSEQAKLLRQQPNDWRLLLQFASDNDIQAMWGEMGMVYFWVRESEARQADFSNVWMILQCS